MPDLEVRPVTSPHGKNLVACLVSALEGRLRNVVELCLQVAEQKVDGSEQLAPSAMVWVKKNPFLFLHPIPACVTRVR